MMQSVLLADDNRDWIEILATKIGQDPDFRIAAKAYDGKEALRLIELHRPDVIFLDVVMPEFDGPYVVNHIREKMPDYDPIIYILSGIGTDSIIKSLSDLNVDYYSMKPVDLSVLHAKLRELVAQRSLAAAALKKTTDEKAPDLEAMISDIVCRLGILPHLKANQCACSALIYYVRYSTDFHQLTKALYPEVAKAIQTTPMAVERNLRRAIYHMLQNKTELYKEIFSYYPVEFITNSEFLSIVSNYIKSRM